MAGPPADLSRGPVLLAFSLSTASFALATTSVRFYTRFSIGGGVGVDDYTAGAATVIALIGTIFGIIEGTASDPTRAVEFNVLGQPWYLVSVTLSKVSICLFFMSLLRRARRWRFLLVGIIVLMAAFSLAFVLAIYVQCRPLEKVWHPSLAGSCSDASVRLGFAYAQGVSSVFTWVFLALFPTLLLRDIARGGEPTWPFYATAGLSVVSGIFVIVRTAQAPYAFAARTYTIHYFFASLMANLEQNLALICTNLLPLGALFPHTTTTSSTTNTAHRRRNPSGSSRTRTRDRSFTSTSTSSSTSTSRPRKPKLSIISISSSRKKAVPARTESARSIVRPDTRSTVRSRGSGEFVEVGLDGGDVERDAGVVAVGGGAQGGGGERAGSRLAGFLGRSLSLGSSRGRRQRAVVGDGDGGRGGDGEEEDGFTSDEGSDIDLEAWPRGIIKTVSVEVVEEVNEEYVAAANAAAVAGTGNTAGVSDTAGAGTGGVSASNKGVGKNSVTVVPGVVGVRQPRSGVDAADRVSGGSGIEQDWETMLRAGPPR